MAIIRFGADLDRARKILTNLAVQNRRVRLTFKDASGKESELTGVMKRVNGNRVTVTHRGRDEWNRFSDLIRIETLI